ncbi:hypothetical protein AAFN85_12740 [Mucilaginibacter sp. CAU 1740]|uniref:hypothetical protein n=1 Tax=Mucilaginibacter sp. CAU 1740 TaxID=3140365 RepID=UPI00325BC123
MSYNLSNQCPNCGAGIERTNNDAFKCTYCGSTFDLSSTPKDPYRPEPVNNNDDEAKKRHQDSLSNREQENQSGQSDEAKGTGIALFFFFALLIITIVIIANHHGDSSSSPYADSLAIDTSTKAAQTDSLKSDTSAPDHTNAGLIRQLSQINVDKVTFAKLYKAARKKRDQFSGSTYIYDRSSPQYVNYNAIYAYIDKISVGSSLRFSIQYTADDWLFIKSVTFNADGENFDYQPTFQTDNGNGAIWEWSDQELDDSYLPMLIKISSAKKVRVKYNGDKYYKIVTVTPLQKAAVKKELQIYKGLLLGYDK